MTLEELAARVEALEGPDATVGAEVEIAIRGFPERAYYHAASLRPRGSAAPDRLEWAAKFFGAGPTASVDAAIPLISPECFWQVGHDGEGADPSAFIARVFDPMKMGKPCVAIADTAALALTAAALRARALSISRTTEGEG